MDVQSRPDLFPPETLSTHYTIERYHLMGSRILSRSFHVLRWKPDGEDADEEAEVDEDEAGAALNADSNARDVDTPTDPTNEAAAESAEETPQEGENSNEDEDEDDDDRYEDPADVAMVPMADMLNGRFNTETVPSLVAATASAPY